MAKVRRLNVTLDVSDDEVDYYIGLGYDHINADGSIIKKAIPRDIATLQRAYVENEKTIAELKKEIATLKGELANSKNKEADKPVTTRKKKSEE